MQFAVRPFPAGSAEVLHPASTPGLASSRIAYGGATGSNARPPSTRGSVVRTGSAPPPSLMTSARGMPPSSHATVSTVASLQAAAHAAASSLAPSLSSSLTFSQQEQERCQTEVVAASSPRPVKSSSTTPVASLPAPVPSSPARVLHSSSVAYSPASSPAHPRGLPFAPANSHSMASSLASPPAPVRQFPFDHSLPRAPSPAPLPSTSPSILLPSLAASLVQPPGPSLAPSPTSSPVRSSQKAVPCSTPRLPSDEVRPPPAAFFTREMADGIHALISTLLDQRLSQLFEPLTAAIQEDHREIWEAVDGVAERAASTSAKCEQALKSLEQLRSQADLDRCARGGAMDDSNVFVLEGSLVARAVSEARAECCTMINIELDGWRSEVATEVAHALSNVVEHADRLAAAEVRLSNVEASAKTVHRPGEVTSQEQLSARVARKVRMERGAGEGRSSSTDTDPGAHTPPGPDRRRLQFGGSARRQTSNLERWSSTRTWDRVNIADRATDGNAPSPSGFDPCHRINNMQTSPDQATRCCAFGVDEERTSTACGAESRPRHVEDIVTKLFIEQWIGHSPSASATETPATHPLQSKTVCVKKGLRSDCIVGGA